MLTKHALSLDDAKQAAAAAAAVAVQNGWKVVVAILDDGGNLLYLERADGTQPGSVDVAIAKGRTAVMFRRPTKAFEDTVAGGRTVMMMLPGATPVEGGLPLIYRGEVVGAIGVSGVQSSQDGQIAKGAADYVAGL